MSLWQYFRSLSSKTRIYAGIGIMAYAGLGLLLSDKAEEKFGMVATEKDREALRVALPKVRSVKGD